MAAHGTRRGAGPVLRALEAPESYIASKPDGDDARAKIQPNLDSQERNIQEGNE